MRKPVVIVAAWLAATLSAVSDAWRDALPACALSMLLLVPTFAASGQTWTTASGEQPVPDAGARSECPDPRALRALARSLDQPRAEGAIATLLRLPRVEAGFPGCHPYRVLRLHRLWEPRAGACHQAVVFFQVGTDCQSRDGPELNPSGYSVLRVDRRGRLRVLERRISPRDPRVLSDLALPDIDGDGWPEWLEHGDAGDAVSGGSDMSADCVTCCLWATRTVRLMSSRDRPLTQVTPLQDVDVPARESLRVALRATAHETAGFRQRAPGPSPRWTYRGLPRVLAPRREGSSIVLEVTHTVRSCDGWEFPPDRDADAPGPCGSERHEVIRFVFEGGRAIRRDIRPVPAGWRPP